jgi:hypothetical protein
MIGKKLNQDSGVRIKLYKKMCDLKREYFLKYYTDNSNRIDSIRDLIATSVYKSFDYWKSVEDI